MLNKIFILVVALLILVCAGQVIYAERHPFMDQQGYIIAMADIHNGVADKASQELAKLFAGFAVPPQYIFVGGDLTEMGTRYEYGKLKQNYEPIWGKIPFGWMLGNHDARWSDQGYYLFEKELGPHYFTVDFDRFIFIGLNSSTLLEQHGHFGEAQVQWLKETLSKIGSEKPIIVQAHHPFGGPSQFTDDGYKIFDALKGYNVPLILVGHGHSWNVKGSYNHSWIQMLGAGMNKKYTPISWDDKNLYLWEAVAGEYVKPLHTVPFDSTRRSNESMDWLTPPAYRNQMVHLFLETEEIQEIKVYFNGESKTFPIMRDGIQSIKWSVKNPLLGKDLLRVEGVGNTTTLLLTQEVVGSLAEVKWTFPSGDSLYTQPALDDQNIYFGNEAGTFYALHKDTGKKIWSYQTDAAILSSPALVGNLVIFGSTDTNLYALEKTTGALVWKTKLPGVIYGGVVVGKDRIAIGTGDYQIYALRPENGQILWKTLGWGMVQSTGTYHNGLFIFTSWGGVVSVIDELTGKAVMSIPSGTGYETPAPSIPAVFQDHVLFTNTGNKYVSQSLKDKKDTWAVTGDSVGYSSVALDGTYGYLSTLQGVIFQFDPKTGKKQWSTDLPQAVYDSSPQLFKQFLVIGTTEGDIWILRQSNGEIVKHLSLGGGFIFGKIRATEDTLYVGSMDGTLYAVDVRDLN